MLKIRSLRGGKCPMRHQAAPTQDPPGKMFHNLVSSVVVSCLTATGPLKSITTGKMFYSFGRARPRCAQYICSLRGGKCPIRHRAAQKHDFPARCFHSLVSFVVASCLTATGPLKSMTTGKMFYPSVRARPRCAQCLLPPWW